MQKQLKTWACFKTKIQMTSLGRMFLEVQDYETEKKLKMHYTSSQRRRPSEQILQRMIKFDDCTSRKHHQLNVAKAIDNINNSYHIR